MEIDDLAERPHERLRRMLDRAGLTNGEVSKSLEVATETVSRWRSGPSLPRGRDLRALIALMATRGIVVTEAWIRFADLQQAKGQAVTEEEPGQAADDSQPRKRAAGQ